MLPHLPLLLSPCTGWIDGWGAGCIATLEFWLTAVCICHNLNYMTETAKCTFEPCNMLQCCFALSVAFIVINLCFSVLVGATFYPCLMQYTVDLLMAYVSVRASFAMLIWILMLVVCKKKCCCFFFPRQDSHNYQHQNEFRLCDYHLSFYKFMCFIAHLVVHLFQVTSKFPNLKYVAMSLQKTTLPRRGRVVVFSSK